MRKSYVFASLALAAAVVSGLAVRAEDKPAKPAAQAFERLKKLEGEWTLPEGKGKFVYKLIAAGTTVEETLMPGTPHEMVTMYHVDGEDLVLTHYCSCGNQPHMKAKLDDPKKLAFTYDGGGNLDPKKDKHMHEAIITFVDDDHMKSEWKLWENGAEKAVHAFDLTRVKK